MFLMLGPQCCCVDEVICDDIPMPRRFGVQMSGDVSDPGTPTVYTNAAVCFGADPSDVVYHYRPSVFSVLAGPIEVEYDEEGEGCCWLLPESGPYRFCWEDEEWSTVPDWGGAHVPGFGSTVFAPGPFLIDPTDYGSPGVVLLGELDWGFDVYAYSYDCDGTACVFTVEQFAICTNLSVCVDKVTSPEAGIDVSVEVNVSYFAVVCEACTFDEETNRTADVYVANLTFTFSKFFPGALSFDDIKDTDIEFASALPRTVQLEWTATGPVQQACKINLECEAETFDVPAVRAEIDNFVCRLVSV